MKRITSIEILSRDNREILPGFSDSFPYISSRAEINRYFGSHVPWHWHSAAELFYIESGELEYSTPGRKQIFPAGSAGFVNSGVLHMSRPAEGSLETVQLLHLFDPALISGIPGGRIAETYVIPLQTSGCELLFIPPDHPLAEALKQSFRLREGERGFELRIRAALSEMWLQLIDLADAGADAAGAPKASDRLKCMMVYVHRNYSRKISIADLADAGLVSKRECHRLFRDQLHCTPLEYITSYRLQMAGERLRNSHESITGIAQSCGFSTSSHFGKIFSARFGCTPCQFRRFWQDRDKKRRK